jgi:Protein phosphatase 2C
LYVAYASSGGAPGRPNEDYVCAGLSWATILDGATQPAGTESGCVHGVTWLVRRLAAAIAARLILEDGASLAGILAAAIHSAGAAHAASCDLSNPDSPSSTVAIVRVGGAALDYLVLADSAVVLCGADQRCTVISDDRLDRLPGGRPYTPELVRSLRNRPGGFWVASTEPEAAAHAVTGTVPLAGTAEAGLFTDGVARLTEWYGDSWPAIFGRLRTSGPGRLLADLRSTERADPRPRAKRHDDATAVYLRLPGGSEG